MECLLIMRIRNHRWSWKIYPRAKSNFQIQNMTRDKGKATKDQVIKVNIR
jgi:hypothetical protein